MNTRTAVVTGAAQGLGYAVSEHLAGEGLNLLVLDLDEEGVRAAAERLGGSSAEVEYRWLDVRDQAQCETEVKFARDRFGSVDVLVNCAGVYPRRDIMTIRKEDWHLDLDVNLIGTYFMMVAAAKVMLDLIQR